MTAVAERQEGAVARPLKVLVPLIKEDINAGRQAGVEFFRAAGSKMLEAKEQLAHGEFTGWIERNFDVRMRQAQEWMALAREEEKRGSPRFSSINDFHRQTGSSSYRSVTSKKDWHEPVKIDIERAKAEAQRLRDETLSRQQEREAERKLALRLIDIGWKVLSKELHPDKGGTRETMSRLNRVRDRLKQHA